VTEVSCIDHSAVEAG